jgi:LacI family transcriptional regulator
MKDIAEDLGVTVATVSKALKGHLDISAATKERVLLRAKQLNYQPSLHAQGLAAGKNYMVGFIVPDLVHAFFSESAKSISDILRTKGYGLMISSSGEDPEIENSEIDQMIQHRVAVLLIASCQHGPDFLSTLKEQNVPHILFDRQFHNYKSHFIGTNDVLVGEIATEHLIAIGRRKIAHIGGQKVSTSIDRLLGYRRTLAKHNLEVPEGYIVTRSRGDESGDITGRQAMERLLRVSPRPNAVFCYNDPAAIGAMDAVLAAGLRIPEDIAIVGCGNIRYSESLRVPLTSVDVSSSELGKLAAELILQLVGDKPPARSRLQRVLIEPQLIVRQSTVSGVNRVPAKQSEDEVATQILKDKTARLPEQPAI